MTDEFIIPDIQTNRKESKLKDLIKKISRKKIFLTKKRNKKLKPENIRKSAFYYPMMFLKKLFWFKDWKKAWGKAKRFLGHKRATSYNLKYRGVGWG